MRAGDVVSGSLDGLSVRSRSGPREGMPPRRFRGDPGDPPAAPPPPAAAPPAASGAEDGTAAELARRSIDGSSGAGGLDVSCSSCACANEPPTTRISREAFIHLQKTLHRLLCVTTPTTLHSAHDDRSQLVDTVAKEYVH